MVLGDPKGDLTSFDLADREGVVAFSLPLFFYEADWCFRSVTIDEACVMEQLLGPYTGEEHAKWGLVVRETHLNRAYTDPAFRLAERSDPDEGRKKRAHGPEELDSLGLIDVRPLRSIGAGDAGGPSCARVDSMDRPLKKALQGPVGSSSSSSGGRLASPPTITDAAEGVASSFGIASLLLEESLGDTPSQVYRQGSEDTQVVPPTPGHDAIGQSLPPSLLFFYSPLTFLYAL